MCLGIPGRIAALAASELDLGKVEFGGVLKDVCLAYVPEAKIGDYVVVHAGFAISIIDALEAEQTLAYLRLVGERVEDETGAARGGGR